jgi:hypothetical protein
MGVADHRARHRTSRRREGRAIVASIARASRVDGAHGSGVGVVPARRASSRCSSIRRREVRPGRAVGADGAALRSILPGCAGNAVPHHEGTRGAAKLAGSTYLKGVAHKREAEGQSKAAGKRQLTPVAHR